VVLWIMAC